MRKPKVESDARGIFLDLAVDSAASRLQMIAINLKNPGRLGVNRHCDTKQHSEGPEHEGSLP